MPASAHHHGDQADQAGAQVIDLASRFARRSQTPVAPAAVPAPAPLGREAAVPRDPKIVRAVVTHMEELMNAHGVSLGDPAVAAASAAWAEFLERVTLGAWRLRVGDEERGLQPDAGRGLDAPGVETVHQMARDMRLAPADFAAMRDVAQEL
jgi:hypothetical protein